MKLCRWRFIETEYLERDVHDSSDFMSYYCLVGPMVIHIALWYLWTADVSTRYRNAVFSFTRYDNGSNSQFLHDKLHRHYCCHRRSSDWYSWCNIWFCLWSLPDNNYRHSCCEHSRQLHCFYCHLKTSLQ